MYTFFKYLIVLTINFSYSYAQLNISRKDIFIVGVYNIKNPKVISTNDSINGKGWYIVTNKDDNINYTRNLNTTDFLYLPSAFLSSLVWSDSDYKKTYNYSLFDSLYKKCINYEEELLPKDLLGLIKTENFILTFISVELLKWQFSNTNYDVSKLSNSGYIGCLTPFR